MGENLTQLQTEAAMSAPLFLVHPHDTLWSVHEQMQARRVRRFVVAESDGKLAGIVTQTNLMQVLDPTIMLAELEHLHGILNCQTSELRQANQELLRKSEETRVLNPMTSSSTFSTSTISIISSPT